MTSKTEKKKELFKDARAKYIEIYNQEEDLDKRMYQTKENIVNLEAEREELKASRPALLADNEDVSEINNRLKEIDDEIELNQDTIKGIKTKKKDIRSQVLTERQETNAAYKEYIEQILADVRKEYMKVAPKLAELLKDYIVLESLRDGDGNGYAYFTTEHVKCLPNFDNGSWPLFKYNYYNIVSNNQERVIDKYDIPQYYVRRVSLSDYNI